MLRAFSPMKKITTFTQAFGLGWYVTAPLALLGLQLRHPLAFRRAKGP